MQPHPPWRPRVGQNLYDDAFELVNAIRGRIKGGRPTGVRVAGVWIAWLNEDMDAAFQSKNETALRSVLMTAKALLENLPEGLTWFYDPRKETDGESTAHRGSLPAPPPSRRRVKAASKDESAALF